MQDTSVVRRYAVALLNHAKKVGTVDAVAADMKSLSDVITQSGQLAAFLNHPLIAGEKKKALVDKTFGGMVSPKVLDFVKLLIDKGRIDTLRLVIAEFVVLVREYKNIAAAEVVTAVPLTDEQRKALEAALEKRTGKDIEIHATVDASVMGGVSVRIGDTILDGTVRSQIERLREQLINTTGALVAL